MRIRDKRVKFALLRVASAEIGRQDSGILRKE